jgi:hypothetical protein
MKNKLIIEICDNCSDWRPYDSYGVGTVCDENLRIVSKKNINASIPNWCPKIKKQNKKGGETVRDQE